MIKQLNKQAKSKHQGSKKLSSKIFGPLFSAAQCQCIIMSITKGKHGNTIMQRLLNFESPHISSGGS